MRHWKPLAPMGPERDERGQVELVVPKHHVAHEKKRGNHDSDHGLTQFASFSLLFEALRG